LRPWRVLWPRRVLRLRWRGRPGRGDLACTRRACGRARGGRVPGQLRGRAPLPLDTGLGPELVRALPWGKTRPFGARVLGTYLVGTGGLEASAARAAGAGLGRAQGPASWLRRQRGGPGSVRLAGGRGHGVRVRPGAGGRGWAVRLWFGGGAGFGGGLWVWGV